MLFYKKEFLELKKELEEIKRTQKAEEKIARRIAEHREKREREEKERLQLLQLRKIYVDWAVGVVEELLDTFYAENVAALMQLVRQKLSEEPESEEFHVWYSSSRLYQTRPYDTLSDLAPKFSDCLTEENPAQNVEKILYGWLFDLTVVQRKEELNKSKEK